MKDFLGQEIKDGDWLVYPGGGNKSAEYGMVLLKVLKAEANKVSVERLDVSYPLHTLASATVKRKKSTIVSGTKLVKVQPSPKMIEVYNNAESNAKIVGEWIHGKKTLKW